MIQGKKLYSRLSDHETVLELWGGSTKHPDSVFWFSDFKCSDWFEPIDQIVPWLLECASKLNFPYYSYTLAKWAIERYDWKGNLKFLSKRVIPLTRPVENFFKKPLDKFNYF